MIQRASRLFGAVSVVAVVLLVAACSEQSDGEAPELSQRDAILNELGPFPASQELSDEQVDAARHQAADAWWSMVAAQYPSLERPEVVVEREAASDEVDELLESCLEEKGHDLGGYSVNEIGLSTPEIAISWFECKVSYPEESHPGYSNEQVAYLYDYLTGFVVPCLEERGSEIDQAPSRETFVANWPNQGWFPAANNGELGSPENVAANLACPSDPT